MSANGNNLSPEYLIPGYLKGELTSEEKNKLLIWIKSDPDYKRLFDEYCEIWITAQIGINHPEYNSNEGFWKFKQKIRTEAGISEGFKRKSLARKLFKYAAIIVITALLSGFPFYYFGRNQVINQGQSMNELVVPLGSSARFCLSDGTIATLNAGSRLRYDNSFGIKERIVSLEGEVFFNVAKISDKPFTVKTSHINVIAMGTAFNVKAYSNDKTIETTLVEGSLKVEGIVSKGIAEVTVLKPNQKLTYFKEDSTLVGEMHEVEKKRVTTAETAEVKKTVSMARIVTENVDVKPVISWKENKWIFEKKSLEEIAVELERKFDIRIEFESERLKAFRFTGTLLAEPIEQVLEVMSISAPINFDLKGKVVTLSENKNFEELNKRLYNQ
jgi:transmembrane sensor